MKTHYLSGPAVTRYFNRSFSNGDPFKSKDQLDVCFKVLCHSTGDHFHSLGTVEMF